MKVDSLKMDKVRAGSICWINTNKNPQMYNNEVVGEVIKVISADTFKSIDYGDDLLLKVSFKNLEGGKKYGKKRIGYIEELIQF